MSILELESLARRHWAEFLPDKVRQLKAEGSFNEAVYGAALLAQQEIEHLMQYQGYSIWEAREVALPLFILLPPEDEAEDDDEAAEIREMEREYRRNPPPEVRMYESSEEDLDDFDQRIQAGPDLPHNRQAALATPSEEDGKQKREKPSEPDRLQIHTPGLVLIDPPGLYSGTLAMWEEHLNLVRNFPLDNPLRQSLIEQAEEMVALRRRQRS